MTKEWLFRIISQYWPMFIRGAGVTLYISIIGTILGFVIGLLIGVIRTIPEPNKGLKRGLLKTVNSLVI